MEKVRIFILFIIPLAILSISCTSKGNSESPIVSNTQTITPVSVPSSTWTQATANAQFSARKGHSSAVFNNKMWVIGGYAMFIII